MSESNTDKSWERFKETIKEMAGCLVSSDMIGCIKEAYKDLDNPLTSFNNLKDVFEQEEYT